jgi:hypothetical protein
VESWQAPPSFQTPRWRQRLGMIRADDKAAAMADSEQVQASED